MRSLKRDSVRRVMKDRLIALRTLLARYSSFVLELFVKVKSDNVTQVSPVSITKPNLGLSLIHI